MPILKKRLSGSTNGRQIKVAATATPGTLLHTAQSGNADNLFDEVWLWATNSTATGVVLTIEWGGVSSPDDQIGMTVPPQSLQGPVLIIPGWIIQNGLIVRAFAATANVIVIGGYVNSLT